MEESSDESSDEMPDQVEDPPAPPPKIGLIHHAMLGDANFWVKADDTEGIASLNNVLQYINTSLIPKLEWPFTTAREVDVILTTKLHKAGDKHVPIIVCMGIPEHKQQLIANQDLWKKSVNQLQIRQTREALSDDSFVSHYQDPNYESVLQAEFNNLYGSHAKPVFFNTRQKMQKGKSIFVFSMKYFLSDFPDPGTFMDPKGLNLDADFKWKLFQCTVFPQCYRSRIILVHRVERIYYDKILLRYEQIYFDDFKKKFPIRETDPLDLEFYDSQKYPSGTGDLVIDVPTYLVWEPNPDYGKPGAKNASSPGKDSDEFKMWCRMTQTNPELLPIYHEGEAHLDKARDALIENGFNWAEKTQNCIAMMVACNYRGSNEELWGADDDIDNITNMMQDFMGIHCRKLYLGYDDFYKQGKNWTNDEVLKFFALNEDMIDELIVFNPTRENMEKYWCQIFEDVYQAESNAGNEEFIWFHFSGHGVQVDDLEGEEEDGKDEALAPTDAEENGYITDDFLNAVVKNDKYSDVDLFCTFDCCHSGSMLDLPTNEEIAKDPAASNFPGRAIAFSSCQDDQTAADIFIAADDPGESKKEFGGFSTAFTKVLTEACLYNIDALKIPLHHIETLVTNNYIKLGIEQQQGVNATVSDLDLVSLASILFKRAFQNDVVLTNYTPVALDAATYRGKKASFNTRDMATGPPSKRKGFAGIKQSEFISDSRIMLRCPPDVEDYKIDVGTLKTFFQKHATDSGMYNQMCSEIAATFPDVRSNGTINVSKALEVVFKKENTDFIIQIVDYIE